MAEDDSESLITECPKCSTRFRVTDSQLQVASGRVRCGACLTVFAGTDYLVSEIIDDATTPSEMEEVLDQLLEELNEYAESGLQTDAGEEELADSRGTPDAFPGHGKEEGFAEDERQFYSGHEEDDLPVGYEVDLEEDGPVAEDAADQPDAEAIAELTDASILAAVEEAVDGEARTLTEGPELVDQPREALEAQVVESAELSRVVPEVEPEVAADADGPSLEQAAGAPVEPTPAARDPLDEISFAPERRRWRFALLVTLAVLALTGQVLWYQFDTWGKQPGLRAFYGAVCAVAGCRLPVLRDVKQIERRQVVVRRHLNQGGALVVDAVIVNLAEFPQPFPELKLRFTAINGTLVAERRFQPREYLAGEISAESLMAPQTPVHIELEIQDPGEDGVNYSLTVH